MRDEWLGLSSPWRKCLWRKIGSGAFFRVLKYLGKRLPTHSPPLSPRTAGSPIRLSPRAVRALRGAAAVRVAAVQVAAVRLAALSPQPSALLRQAQPQPSEPIIVKIVETPAKSELNGLADVLLGSLGLTGVIVLGAILLGLVFASVLFWVRSRQT